MGRGRPCSFRKRPQALQRTEPDSSRLQSGVVLVVQFWQTGWIKGEQQSVMKFVVDDGDKDKKEILRRSERPSDTNTTATTSETTTYRRVALAARGCGGSSGISHAGTICGSAAACKRRVSEKMHCKERGSCMGAWERVAKSGAAPDKEDLVAGALFKPQSLATATRPQNY